MIYIIRERIIFIENNNYKNYEILHIHDAFLYMHDLQGSYDTVQ